MRYAQIRSLDVSNGIGCGVSLFVQGCPHHCKGCFNEETWDFNGGEEFDSSVQKNLFDMIDKQHIKRVSILGGEPLCPANLRDVTILAARIRLKYGHSKKIWIYTGYTYEELDDQQRNILNVIDVLVDGRYIEELKDLSYPFAGSTNQRVIDVEKSHLGNVVLYDF